MVLVLFDLSRSSRITVQQNEIESHLSETSESRRYRLFIVAAAADNTQRQRGPRDNTKQQTTTTTTTTTNNESKTLR
jgi:hypothetical protein